MKKYKRSSNILKCFGNNLYVTLSKDADNKINFNLSINRNNGFSTPMYSIYIQAHTGKLFV